MKGVLPSFIMDHVFSANKIKLFCNVFIHFHLECVDECVTFVLRREPQFLQLEGG